MRLGRKIAIAAAKLRQLGLRRALGLFRDRAVIRRSPLFDAAWYLANNSDVADSGVDPALHYLLFGVSGNRSPSTGFVTDEYLALHADVRAAGVNPLLHYERTGRREGRAISFQDPPACGPDAAAAYAGQQASFPARCAHAAAKLRRGERLKAVFFVSNAAMFPARPLFDAMRASDDFDPFVVVVPDLRWHDGSEMRMMEACRAELARTLPPERLAAAARDARGVWRDVLEDADLACYSSPYELSAFRYNPRYSVGRAFLPISVNYGYYRSAYDRQLLCRQSYAWMWKAFFECAATLEEYRRHSPLGGANGEVVGYVKMDALAAVRPEPHARKRVLVALHHSVSGGTNDTLSLANLVRLADFFRTLPDRFPDVDFVFRPHPFLLKVLARPGQWGEARTARYVAALRAKPNVFWSKDGDYFRAFAESDACIQDCGSYLVEYFYTGKPCCYMLKAPADVEAKFAPLGKECLANCYLAYDADAIARFVADVVVAGNDPMRPARAAFAGRVMVNYPHAAEAALEHIRSALLAPTGEARA